MTGRIEGADFLKVIQVCRQNVDILPFLKEGDSYRSG